MEKTAQELAAQFLARVQLNGAEVPAFNHVMAWLESTLEPAEPAAP